MNQPTQSPDIRMDADDLYREDSYTDNRIGSIRCLTPVTKNGEADDTRSVQYLGSTQILTPAGPLPLNFELPGDSLEAAIAGFGDAAREAVDKTMQELREMQRQSASQIVVPKGGVDPSAMDGLGGKIKMP